MSKHMFDAIVVGGGVMGSATAASLSKRGLRVALLEQFQPTHKFGSSHGDARIIRTAYPDEEYIPLSLDSFTAWDELGAILRKPVIKLTGGVDFAFKKLGIVPSMAAMLKKRNVSHQTYGGIEFSKRFPHFRLTEDMEGIYHDLCGILFADACVKSFWQLAKLNGAVCEGNSKVSSISLGNCDVTVATVKGDKYTAKSCVIAAGSWMNHVLRRVSKREDSLDPNSAILQLPLTIYQEVVSYFPVKASCTLDHTYNRMPTFIPWMQNGLSDFGYYGLPHVEIPGVKFAAHYCGPEVDPCERVRDGKVVSESSISPYSNIPAHDMHPQNARMVTKTSEFVAEYMPGLEPHGQTLLNCLYTATPDHHFVMEALSTRMLRDGGRGKINMSSTIGQKTMGGPGIVSEMIRNESDYLRKNKLNEVSKDDGRLVLVSPCSGHGFKFAPVIGDMAACMVMGETQKASHQQAANKFRVSRFFDKFADNLSPEFHKCVKH